MARSENPVVTAVKEFFPGFDYPLYSKTKRPSIYGIRLTAKAQAIADKALKQRKKRDGHKGHTVSWRAGEALLARLQTAKRELGIITNQEVITVAVMKLLESLDK